MIIWGFSPGFWRRQWRIAAIFVFLSIAGYFASLRRERAFYAEDLNAATIPIAQAFMVLDEIKANVRTARAKTIGLCKMGDYPLESCLRFRDQKGNHIVYFENAGGLYVERNGIREKLLDDVAAVYFQAKRAPRKRADQPMAITIELQVWETKDVSEFIRSTTARSLKGYVNIASGQNRSELPRHEHVGSVFLGLGAAPAEPKHARCQCPASR